jgi:hypothetical protein
MYQDGNENDNSIFNNSQIAQNTSEKQFFINHLQHTLEFLDRKVLNSYGYFGYSNYNQSAKIN